MQSGCDQIEFLISKAVDSEATPEERELVDSHVAGCDRCAYKLTSFMEMAAIFSDAPVRPPDAQVRSGVFTEIKRLQEADRRHQEVRTAGDNRHSSLPPFIPPTQVPARNNSLGSRLWSFGSPLAVMGTAVAVLIVVMTLAAPPAEVYQPMHVATVATPAFPIGIGTEPVPSIYMRMSPDAGIPSPVVTKMAAYSPAASASIAVRSTATYVSDLLLALSEPTAVMESGDPSKLSSWHLVKDAAYGYSISYPPNWWTRVQNGIRYFFPWGLGGTRYAPYWIELRVQDNPYGHTAETANDAMFKGACKVESGSRGEGKCLRRTFSDEANVYNELYAFDASHIYLLRAKVPMESSLGDFQARWEEAQLVLARMSGSMSLAPDGVRGALGYGPVLFLNGTDLWAANAGSSGTRPLTRGYVVRQYALSPDLRQAAFAATNDNTPQADAKYLYVADSESEGLVTPRLLASTLVVYDIAWYGDRELLTIARSQDGVFGIYRLDVNLEGGTIDHTPRLLVELGSDMLGARGLSVSPDRQLITFLAPLGELKGTDIYALRPDGSDLRKVVSHSDPLPPATGEEDALTHEHQAIKSYTWLDGSLEYGGYHLDMLFTCGTFSSPSLYRGGFLYSTQTAGRGTMLNPFRLGAEDPFHVQIVHVAYSSHGKVALTGFYNLRDSRAEVLAGLWTADVADGGLINLKAHELPASPNGISDLQWSPDGESVIYRETVPREMFSIVSRYEGEGSFKMMRLNPSTGERTVLYDGTGR
jgi:hypothetical protein